MADVEVDWGDGTSSTVVVADTDDWSFEGEAHTYDDSNFYLVTVTGPEGGKASQQVDVTVPPPTHPPGVVTATDPDTGSVSGFTLITFTGTGLQGVSIVLIPDAATDPISGSRLVFDDDGSATDVSLTAFGLNQGLDPLPATLTHYVVLTQAGAETGRGVLPVPFVATT